MPARWFRPSAILLVARWSTLLCGQELTTEQWEADLARLAKELPALHVSPFAHTSEENFRRTVAGIRADLPSLARHEIVARYTELVCTIGDAHTTISPPKMSLQALPLQFYWFPDGIYVIGTSPDHSHALGAKLMAIGDCDLQFLLRRLEQLLPHDNEFGLKNLVGQHLGIADTLRLTGAWPEHGKGRLALRKSNMDFEVSCVALPLADARGIAWDTREGEPPPYATQGQLDHWNDWLPASRTLYFKYNRCRNAGAFQRLVRGTEGFIAQHDVQRFVLDLRNNLGGDSTIFDPLHKYLLQHEQLNRKDRLFVIIGRQTSSSGLINAMQMKDTNATFVGEPTGGKPNHFGEIKTFELENSKLVVSYSTKIFYRPEYRSVQALQPNIRTTLTYEQWFSGRDPAMEAILK